MLYSQIKTASDLKAFVENGPDSLFFTRDTMRFWGDTMRNYGIRRVGSIVSSSGKEYADAIELYRRRPVKGGLQRSAYFVADGPSAARRVLVSTD